MTSTASRELIDHDESEEAVLADTHGMNECATTTVESDCTGTVNATTGSRHETDPPLARRTRVQWCRVLAYGVLPGVAMTMAIGAGYLKWYESSAHDRRLVASESVRVASDGAIAMLSYRPETVDKDLAAAKNRLTGPLKDSYSALTHDIVIPGSKQKAISAAATVPAAGSVSASPDHAVVLLFVDQTITVGNDAPTSSASRVRVTLDKTAGRWLISLFDPL